MNKKNRIISMLLFGVISAGIMTGCEKASERIIYIGSSRNETQAGSSTSFSKVENIGAEALLETISFTFEGVEMIFDKKPYSDFREMGWTFDPATYGLNDIQANQGNLYQRGVYLQNDSYDPDVFCIGLTNFNQDPCPIEDTQIWSAEFTAHEKSKYPDIVINGGITWGSPKEDIIKAYGKPNSSKRNDDSGSDTVHYTDNAGNNIYFEVYDDEGVGKIILESYKP